MPYPSYHIWIVNLKWWNDLPKEKREILRQAALAAQNWDRQDLDDTEAEYIKKLQKLMTTHMQTNAEADEWRRACQAIAEGWLKKTGAEGKKLLELIMETRREYMEQKKK